MYSQILKYFKKELVNLNMTESDPYFFHTFFYLRCGSYSRFTSYPHKTIHIFIAMLIIFLEDLIKAHVSHLLIMTLQTPLI